MILNGALSWSFTFNSTGDIIKGCNEYHYMDVTGCYEASVRHLLMIHKPFSIWNFRMGYNVLMVFIMNLSLY